MIRQSKYTDIVNGSFEIERGQNSCIGNTDNATFSVRSIITLLVYIIISVHSEDKTTDTMNVTVKSQSSNVISCDPYERVPEALESSARSVSSSTASDTDDEEGGEGVGACNDESSDHFDVSSAPILNTSSCTIPVVLEVAPRNGRYQPDDPLSNCVCLFNMSNGQDKNTKATSVSDANKDCKNETTSTSSWLFSSVLKQFLSMKQ